MQKRRAARGARRPGVKINVRVWLVAVLAVAAVLLLVLLLKPTDSLLSSPEIVHAQKVGVLRVGVQSAAPGFANDGDGLDIAIAREIVRRMFPDSDPNIALELTPVTQYTALPMLAEGDIDLAFAAIWSVKDTSFAYTGAYFADSVRLVCRKGDENAALTGQKVGLIAGTGAESAYTGFAQKHEKATTFVNYASYPDLVAALKAGKIDFFAAPGKELPSLLGEGLSLHAQELGYVQYVAASQADSSAFALFADMVIQDMKSDGTLQKLVEQYGLTAYQHTGG